MKLVFSVAIAAIALAFTSNAAEAKDGGKLGKGDYFIQVAPKINDDGSVTPRRLTTGQFDFTLRLDELCRVDAKKYSPSIFKIEALSLLRSIPGSFISGGLGAKLGGFTGGGGPSVTDYGAYNGVATVGGVFGNGFTAQAYGKKGFMGSCMSNMLVEVRHQGYGKFVEGVYIIYNTYPVNGHAIKKSDLPVASLPSLDSSDDDSISSPDDEVINPPPPPHP